MMAQQVSVDPSDFWYVAVAPGETKILSLEQLDDFFRLEIIDASTRVWQPGMTEWLPLSVVAGIDEPAPVRPPPPSMRAPSRSAPPPASMRRPTAAAAAPAQRPAPVASLPAPRPAPAPTTTMRPAAAPHLTAVPSSGPWPVAATAAPFSAAPAPAPIESFRPLVVSQRPVPMPAQGGGWAGRFVMAIAVLAGTGLTLYRNDMLRQLAVSAGQERTYLRMEAALGGPGFGTPRAVESLTASSLPPSSTAPSAPSYTTSPSAGSERNTETSAPSSGSPHASAEKAESATNTHTVEVPTATHTSESTARATERPARTSESTRHAETTKPTHTSAATRPARTQSARSESHSAGASAHKNVEREPERGLGFKGSSNNYDPLNGKL